MKELTVFNYEKNNIRVVNQNGEPWFVAKDVCEVLGVTWNGNHNLRHVPEQWRGVIPVMTRHQNQHGTWIEQVNRVAALSEQGLYFFINRSDSPAALPFQMWIAGEVIPQIRKTGGYIPVEAGMSDMEILSRALLIARNTIVEKDKVIEQQSQQIEAQTEIINEWSPLVEKYKDWMDTDGGFSLDTARRILDVPKKKWFDWLRANGWISKARKYNRKGEPTGYKNHAMTKALVKGYLDAKLFKNPKTKYEGEWTIVTPKGLDFFYSKRQEIR